MLAELSTDTRSALRQARQIVFLAFDHDVSVTSERVLAESVLPGLRWPTFENALYFGIEHPDMQFGGPVFCTSCGSDSTVAATTWASGTTRDGGN